MDGDTMIRLIVMECEAEDVGAVLREVMQGAATRNVADATPNVASLPEPAESRAALVKKPRRGSKGRAVRDVESGKVFASVADMEQHVVGRKTNTAATSIKKHGEWKGKKYEFVTDEDAAEKEAERKDRRERLRRMVQA